jgi:hypothetical protein
MVNGFETVQARFRGRRDRRRVIGSVQQEYLDLCATIDTNALSASPLSQFARPPQFGWSSRQICRPVFSVASDAPEMEHSCPSRESSTRNEELSISELEVELAWAKEALWSRIRHLQSTSARPLLR